MHTIGCVKIVNSFQGQHESFSRGPLVHTVIDERMNCTCTYNMAEVSSLRYRCGRWKIVTSVVKQKMRTILNLTENEC